MYESFNIIDPVTKENYPQSIYHNVKTLQWVANPKILRQGAGARVMGNEIYSNDILMTNMVFLKLKRAPYSHATVTSIDVTKAKALPGVVGVLTYADVPNLINAAPYFYCVSKDVWNSTECVAAVVATEEDIAEQALALIDVKYTVLPFVLHQDDALKAGAYILHGATNEVGTAAPINRGDVNAAFAKSDNVINLDWRNVTKPFFGVHPVGSVEQESFTCNWENERMAVWSSTQSPWGSLRSVAAALNLPYSKVAALNSRMGTGFGNKGSDGAGVKIAAYFSYTLHRPVKWYQDMDGYFGMNSSAWTCQNHVMKMGVNKDGTITGISDICQGNGGYRGNAAAQSSMAPFAVRIKTANMYLEGHDAYTNTQGAGIPRCVQHVQASVAFSVLMDMAAESIGIDPADFLLKNTYDKAGVGAQPEFPTYDVGCNSAPGYISDLITLSGWKSKWKGWKTPMAVNGPKKTGIGISVHNCSHGALSNPESATVMLEPDGSCRCVTGSQDMGQGWRTAAAIMTAEEMGIDYSLVTSPNFATENTQESRSPGGSTVTRGTGTAVILACRDAKEQLFKLAIIAKKFTGVTPDQLETAYGYIYQKSGAAPTSYTPGTAPAGSVWVKIADVCALMTATAFTAPAVGTYSYGGPIIGRGSYATARNGNMMQLQQSGTTAEVEVDTNTGEVEVKNFVEIVACGRNIFYQGNYNQTVGGIAFMIGHALYTGLAKDEATGLDLNPNYTLFKCPTSADMPTMTIGFNETLEPYAPFGAKGTAEPIMPSASSSIWNAIYNACGVRSKQAHMTPDVILAGLGKA